jgi:hypothetical protein
MIDEIKLRVEANSSLSRFALESAIEAIESNDDLPFVARGGVSIRFRYPEGFLNEIKPLINSALQSWLVCAMRRKLDVD